MNPPESRLWILVCGLPGTGKTTIAKTLASALGADHCNTDQMRARMGLMGHYHPADKAHVYAALMDQARQWVSDGRLVVIDATFSQPDMRAQWIQAAADLGVTIHWIEVRADESVIRQRVRQPRPDSEADEAVYEQIRSEWSPLPDDHLVLRTDEGDPAELVRQALDWLHLDPKHPDT